MAYFDAWTGQMVVKQKEWIASTLLRLQADLVEGLREGYLEDSCHFARLLLRNSAV